MMFADVRYFFSLPLFVTEQQRDVFNLIKRMLLVISATILLYALSLPLFAPYQTIHFWLIGGGLLCIATISWAIYQEQLRMASMLLVGWTWAFVTLVICTTKGDEPILAFTPYLLCILLAQIFFWEKVVSFLHGVECYHEHQPFLAQSESPPQP